MPDPSTYLQSSITEYASTASAHRKDPEGLEHALSTEHEWTPQAAETLVRLANDYGAFMLRHALALAVALDVEDGDLNF